MGIFRRDDKPNSPKMVDRPPRNSSGWRDILKYLKETESLRVLDFGATSSHNINYLTGMGHSVYMANVVQEAARPEWRKPLEDFHALCCVRKSSACIKLVGIDDELCAGPVIRRCQHGKTMLDPRPLRHALKHRPHSRVLEHCIREVDEGRMHVVSGNGGCDAIDVRLSQGASGATTT